MIETSATPIAENPFPALAAALKNAGVDADASNLQRAIYSTDASIYRVLPAVVVFPRSADDLEATLAVCREHGVPLTTRGAGTSVAGNAIGTGVVLDVSRYMNRIVSLDPRAQVAVVEPGVVQAQLQTAAAAHSLRFGPDPSTSTRCTIGGMIGNNACGSRALAYGRTSDNVVSLEVITGTGETLASSRSEADRGVGPGSGSSAAALQALVAPNSDLIRREFGRFPRQVSGYALETLLPENGFDVGRLLCGSEGTLALTSLATVRLVADPPHRALLALGYPSMADAADAAPRILPYGPTAVEGIDARIVNAVRARFGPIRVPPLPRGEGWLFVELVGESVADVTTQSIKVANDSGCIDSLIVTDGAAAAALWKIREDGAGLASRTPDGRPAYAGWEDAAVPPAQLGNYLRDFEALLVQHGLVAMPYGHFGDGCIHVRLDFPLTETNGAARMRAFVTDAAQTVAKYGGSMSGEHGDGRARSELLTTMYSDPAIALMGEVKAIFDPDHVLNPGIIVAPRQLDDDLRVPAAPAMRKKLGLAYRHDHGDFSESIHKCVGVGKCRADNTDSGGVMCPSFFATRDEKDSTRGRARVLQEMINGEVVKDKWRSPEVHEALDLCLSCKGCATDCPTGVDMASYKAEVLYQSYKHRLRPRAHYFLGWLPRWAKLAARQPRWANFILRTPGLKHVGRWSAGVDQRRSLPQFSAQTFRAWMAEHQTVNAGGKPVALWVDTFTNYFDPAVGIAAVEVLESAGYEVFVTKKNVCCGLTWISTGQLDTAKRKLRKSVKALRPYVDKAIPVVGLEPSCTGVLRSDILELLNNSEAERTAHATKTLAELLAQTDGWHPPDLSQLDIVAQPHCHHSSVMGWSVDADLLQQAGADIKRLGGCCGLAGNFGVEKGHYDVSVKIAEHQLLPAVDQQSDEGVVLADGFSCRTQLQDLAHKPSQHLAQLLADATRQELA